MAPGQIIDLRGTHQGDVTSPGAMATNREVTPDAARKVLPVFGGKASPISVEGTFAAPPQRG